MFSLQCLTWANQNKEAEQTLVGLTVRRRPPVHLGDWVSRGWRRRYLPWSWRGSPTAAPATFSCSASLGHLLTGLQGLLLPHPRGQLIHQPPCGVRVMVSWRSRPDRAADRDGWYPLQRRVSDDQIEEKKKKEKDCDPPLDLPYDHWELLAVLGEGSKVIFPHLWWSCVRRLFRVQLPERSSRWQYILTSAEENLLQATLYSWPHLIYITSLCWFSKCNLIKAQMLQHKLEW